MTQWEFFPAEKIIAQTNKQTNKQKQTPKDRTLPIISPRLLLVQKAFLVGLFSGELIFGGA